MVFPDGHSRCGPLPCGRPPGLGIWRRTFGSSARTNIVWNATAPDSTPRKQCARLAVGCMRKFAALRPCVKPCQWHRELFQKMSCQHKCHPNIHKTCRRPWFSPMVTAACGPLPCGRPPGLGIWRRTFGSRAQLERISYGTPPRPTLRHENSALDWRWAA